MQAGEYWGMIFRLIWTAIQELRGGPNRDGKPANHVVVIACLVTAAVIIALGIAFPDATRAVLNGIRAARRLP